MRYCSKTCTEVVEEAQSMSRLNNFIKLSVFFLNGILALIGLGLVVAGGYLVSGSLGKLDTGSFVTFCAVVIIFGVNLTALSCFGCMGAVYQTKREGLL
jgi:membrane-bound ClpP family serine protease